MKIVQTADGSLTLLNETLNEIYHSRKGALQESLHVFIKNGLERQLRLNKSINLLEVGFGTGLNALLTLDYISEKKCQVSYFGVECDIVPVDIIKKLDYEQYLQHEDLQGSFLEMHNLEWDTPQQLSPNFGIHKVHASILEAKLRSESFDLVYFDAFAPSKQATMWETSTLEKVYGLMKKAGALVTYCAKGSFKRSLKSLGFDLEILEGPAGKREMVRAIKV